MRVRLSHLRPNLHACFLWIEYNDSTYIGSVIFDNQPFHRLVSKLLEEHCGCTIDAIGSLEIGHTL
jgi:hypothetical protein